MQYFLAALSVAFGFYVVINHYAMVKLVGKTDWAERYLGVGGSYTMWKLIGIGCLFLAFFLIKDPGFFSIG